MIRNRKTAKELAERNGYFWLPCPVCKEPFAGFEHGEFSVMETPGSGTVACGKPECQAVAKKSYEKFGMTVITHAR